MSSKFYKSATSSVSDIDQLQTKITSLQNIINRITPLIFLLESDTIYEFGNTLSLDFPKYNLYTDIRLDLGKLTFVSYPNGTKLKISIRLMYNWQNTDYAPRFKYNLIVNDIVVLTDGSDVNDSSDESVKNVSNVVFVHNFLKNDKVELVLTKNSSEIEKIIMFKKSNIEFTYV